MKVFNKALRERVKNLSLDTILIKTPHSTIREQENQFLIYNTVSDEMHMVSPLANYIYQLCDGVRSVGDISSYFIQNPPDNTESINTELLLDYFESLLDRGLIETDNDYE